MSEDKGPDFEAGIDEGHVPNGGMIAGTWRGQEVFIARHRGDFYALSAKCTHMDAPLREGIVADCEVHCPWHHARFALATGEAVGAPAFAPLTRFGTVARDGRVFVTAPGIHAAGQDSTPAGQVAKRASQAAKPASQVAELVRPVRQAARVVIVGAGAAGHACAEWLLRSDFQGRLTIVSDDADAPYDRTVCSKQYLLGMKTRAESSLVDASPQQQALQAALRLNSKVREIDAQAKWLTLEDGERIGFDTLVLATGAEPQRAKWPGSDYPNVHVLRTLRDADALIQASKQASRIAVVGAGFIALEAAASLKQRKLEVHVVAPDDVPLKRLLGADVGEMIRLVHEEKGVQFHLGREVRGFSGRQLTLDDGSVLEADFVVLGIGVAPRIALAQSAGIECAAEAEGGGVIVDARLETSIAGIFAIGDIARYPDAHIGKKIRVEHWVHAQRQGQHVARVIMGSADAYTDVPFFWSAHFDTGLRYLGHVGSIVDTQTQGSIDKRDFGRCYRGAGAERAYVTCNRDTASLLEESNWDRALGLGAASP